jgi:hypothetical protein
MPVTYKKIASVTVGSGGAASIDFTSIPATYTDLLVMFSGRGDAPNTQASVTIQFNANASSYASRWVRGNGSAASSGVDTYGTDEIYIGEVPAATATTSTFGNACIYIPNYTVAANKSVSIDMVSENNATQAWTYLTAGLWSNTDSITSIKLLHQGAAIFVQHSTATLYGIKKD